jgi:hypothetical protein
MLHFPMNKVTPGPEGNAALWAMGKRWVLILKAILTSIGRMKHPGCWLFKNWVEN